MPYADLVQRGVTLERDARGGEQFIWSRRSQLSRLDSQCGAHSGFVES